MISTYASQQPAFRGGGGGSTDGWQAGLTDRVYGFDGDSRTIQGQVTSSGVTYWTNRSHIYWMRFLSRQVFDTLPSLNYAVGGRRSDQILAAQPPTLSSMVAAGVKTYVILGGTTNDRGATNPSTGTTYTAQNSIDNFSAIVANARAAGLRVLVFTETPRSDLTGQLKADHVAVKNAQLSLNNPSNGVLVIDAWTPLADTTDPTVAASWATVDGIHLSVRGCQAVGFASAPSLTTYMAPRDVLPQDNTQGTGQNQNLLTNALMTGPGPVASSWVVTNNAGGTVAVNSSIVTSGGKSWQQMDISGTPSGNDASPLFVRLEQVIDSLSGQLTAGDTVDSVFEIEVDNPVGVRSVDLFLVGPNIFDGAADIAAPTSAYQIGPSSYQGILRPPPLVISTVPALLRSRLRVVVANGVPASITVRARAAAIKRTNR